MPRASAARASPSDNGEPPTITFHADRSTAADAGLSRIIASSVGTQCENVTASRAISATNPSGE